MSIGFSERGESGVIAGSRGAVVRFPDPPGAASGERAARDSGPESPVARPTRPSTTQPMPIRRGTSASEIMAELGLGGVGALPLWKRVIDVVGAALLLLLLSPVLVVVAFAVIVDSRGGAFFGQDRVGRGGRLFTCWKFRSMHRNAEALWESLQAQNEAKGHLFKMQNDPRVTRVGRILRKTSLDELPQLWNVLRGEMSLVGPRPPLTAEVARYAAEHYRRLEGVPGITGLWQVVARDRHDFDEMVELDVRYLRELSFRSDLSILLRTIPVVLFGRGGY